MTKIIQRHDTAANWANINPILAQGEMGIEDDTRKFKFGDGTTAWADLGYASSEGGGGTLNYDDLINKPKVNGVELSGDKTSSLLKLEPEFTSNLPLNKYTQTKSNYINGSSDGSTITLNNLAYVSTNYRFNDAAGTSYNNDRIYPAGGVAYIPVSDSGGYWYGIHTGSTSSVNFYALAFVNVDNENGIKFLSLSKLPYSPSYSVTNKLVSGISTVSGSTYYFTTSDYNSATVSDTTYNGWVLVYVDKPNKQVIISNAGTRTILGGFDDTFFNNINAILIGNYKNSTTNSAIIPSDSIFKKALLANATGAEVVKAPDNLINIADFTTQNYLSLNVDNNTIKVNDLGKLESIPQETPIATTSTVGTVKPDGTSITITEDGTISSTGGSSVNIATVNTAGIVKPDGDTITITEDGTISSPIDGQWVFASKNIIFQLDVTETGKNVSLEYDLSDYLPADTNLYEVIINGYVRLSTASGLYVWANGTSTGSVSICGASAAGSLRGSAQVYISSDKKLTITYYANSTSDQLRDFTLIGYRKVR